MLGLKFLSESILLAQALRAFAQLLPPCEAHSCIINDFKCHLRLYKLNKIQQLSCSFYVFFCELMLTSVVHQKVANCSITDTISSNAKANIAFPSPF